MAASITPVEKGKANSRGAVGHEPVSGRATDMIKVWASIGFITLIIVVSGIVRRVFSEDFIATPVGSDPYPYLTYLRIVEIGSALFLLYFFVTCILIATPIIYLNK